MSKYSRFTSMPPQRQQQNTYTYDYQLKQQQVQVQTLTQTQTEIRYYIYQHMQFLANLLFSMEEIFNYFQDEPNHPMITIGLNKIILQMNLMNTTNVDLQERLTSPDEVKELQQCKENAKKVILQATQNLNPQLQQYVRQYIENSLSNRVTVRQVNGVQTSQPYNFNQQVVQDIFNAMSKTDQEVERLHQTRKYETPIPSEVQQIAKQKFIIFRQFQQRTLQKLSNNFPKKQSSRNNQQQQPQQFKSETQHQKYIEQTKSQIVNPSKSNSMANYFPNRLQSNKQPNQLDSVQRKQQIMDLFTTTQSQPKQREEALSSFKLYQSQLYPQRKDFR